MSLFANGARSKEGTRKSRRRADLPQWRLGFTFEPLEDRRLLSAVSWDGGGDGTNWTDPLNWSNDALPGASDDVTISIAANPTIRLASGTQQIHSLVSDELISLVGGTLDVQTTATISASLSMAGGALRGGTLTETGAGQLLATSSGGTLDGVTVNGNLDLSQQNNANLTVLNNLVLNGTLLLGNTDGSLYGRLYVGTYGSGSQTLSGNATVLFGGSGNNGIYNNNNGNGAGATLTIAPTVTLHGTAGFLDNYYTQATIVNQGTISADVAGGQLSLGNIGTFTNQATLSALNGATLNLKGTWTSALGSTITVNNSTLNLGGSFTQTGLTLDRTGGTVNLVGTVTGNLVLDATTGVWNLAGGALRGGTLTETGAGQLLAHVQWRNAGRNDGQRQPGPLAAKQCQPDGHEQPGGQRHVVAR